MRWEDAYLHIEDKSPGVDAALVLDMLKKQDRVKFNETNRVFTYEPEIVLKNQADLRTHIRTHSQPTKGLLYKEIREAMPVPELTGYLEDLEREGHVMILRSLTGKLKDAPVPSLGRSNAWGDKLNGGGPERWKTVFWDELRERGRAADRVDDGGGGRGIESLTAEFVFEWADVVIGPEDDVAKLLASREWAVVGWEVMLTALSPTLFYQPCFTNPSSALFPEDLKASTAVTQEKKKTDDSDAKGKKKKRRGRALKITNTHMKALGIDFSKEYQGE